MTTLQRHAWRNPFVTISDSFGEHDCCSFWRKSDSRAGTIWLRRERSGGFA